MGDELVISGSGSSSVATDELYAAAQQVRQLAIEASGIRSELMVVDRMVSMGQLQASGAPAGAARAELDMDQAVLVLFEIESSARAIDWALGTAADGYGFVEKFLGGLGEGLFSAVGRTAGSVAVPLAMASPLIAVGGAAVVAAAAPSFFGRDNNQHVTSPLAATVVRDSVMAADDTLFGALGVPPGVAQGVGAAGLGIAAGSVMRAGSNVGLLTETPVQLVSVRAAAVEGAPAGFADRLSRVPDTDETDGAQVVIERYEIPGEPDRFEVYVAGTVTFSPVADSEPWDMTSNVANAAGFDGGSYRSVVEAMRAAGIGDDNPVQLTGYSQGGGTAARVAASGEFDVQGLLTFGGPTGQVPIPSDITAVIVEHTDDIVPALGGAQLNRDAVIVQRDVFAGVEIPNEYAVPAHHYEYYEETARLMDDAQSEQVTGAMERLDSFTAGATNVSTTTYRFERQP